VGLGAAALSVVSILGAASASAQSGAEPPPSTQYTEQPPSSIEDTTTTVAESMPVLDETAEDTLPATGSEDVVLALAGIGVIGAGVIAVGAKRRVTA
jgi:LPXTG-motif cell wall-anchored protein